MTGEINSYLQNPLKAVTTPHCYINYYAVLQNPQQEHNHRHKTNAIFRLLLQQSRLPTNSIDRPKFHQIVISNARTLFCSVKVSRWRNNRLQLIVFAISLCVRRFRVRNLFSQGIRENTTVMSWPIFWFQRFPWIFNFVVGVGLGVLIAVTTKSTVSTSHLLILVSCLAYSSTLKTEATCPYETSGFLRTRHHYSPDDRTLRGRWF
jgi:hypothetical protein